MVMTGVGDDSRGRSWGAPWFGVGVALAVAATIALVLADDIRYLRLGIVAALWAALVGAFVAARYRKQAATTEETVTQAQEIYELELEREIAARREYELEIESETRQRVEADSRAELDGLRAEINALRENLQSLFGGEVLLERLSLTAQATRMRALREEQRLVDAPVGNARPAIPAAKKNDLLDRPTELIERVREKQSVRPAGRTASPAPEPRRPERSLDLPPRRVSKSEPVPVRGTAAANAAKAGAEAREQTRVQSPVVPSTPVKKAPQAKKPMPTEVTRPAVIRSERSRPSMRPPGSPERDQTEAPTQVAKMFDPDRSPTWESGKNQQPAPAAARKPGAPTQEVPAANGATKLPRRPAKAEPIRPGESEIGAATGQAASLFTPNVTPNTKEQAPIVRSEPAAPAVPSVPDEPPASNPTLPEEARRVAQRGRPGGRRRRADDVATGEPAAPEGGGRRHRADGEPPSWMQPAAEDGATRRRAGHSRPELAPVAEPVGAGRRGAGETADESGSHSAGRSVSELLAAHGTEAGTPRRRRRAAE
jgi:uncharacterized protein DUF6779